MKLTKNTNKVRIEDPQWEEPEVYTKLANGDWLIKSSNSNNGLKLDEAQFKSWLKHDESLGRRIFDISCDCDASKTYICEECLNENY